MLGTEQVNLIPRMATPLLEGVESIRITDQVAKSMGLQDNQIVRGVIEDRQGIIRLILNNRDFELKSNKKFKPGDAINFRVQNTKSGVTLNPVISDTNPTSSVSSINNFLSGGDVSKILSLFYRPAQASSLAKFFSPESLNQFMAELGEKGKEIRLNQLMTTMRNFSPEMARSAMQNSGLFGESMLSKQSFNRSDLKHILRTLLTFTSLGNSERTLISQAIDEIESNQLESLSAQKNRDVSYSFVIPFSDSDPVEINIEAESDSIEREFQNESQVDESDQSSRRNNSPYKWVVNLYTDSKELGEIWSKATFKNAMTVEMILWARNEQSVELAQLEEGYLKELFAGFGISLDKFVVLNAERPRIEKSLTGPGQVLDVRT